jgi:ketosteroid isomerase-like protein
LKAGIGVTLFAAQAVSTLSWMDRDVAVETLGRLHAAQGEFYAGGDAGALRGVLTEDVEWHVPGTSPIAGDYAGTRAVMDYFGRRRDRAARTFRMLPGDLLSGDGDRVAVLTDGVAVLGGREEHWSTVGLYRLRGDRIAGCWLLPLDPVAFDRIWSA